MAIAWHTKLEFWGHISNLISELFWRGVSRFLVRVVKFLVRVSKFLVRVSKNLGIACYLVLISPVFLCNTYFDFYDNLIYIFIYVKSSFFLLPFFSRKSLYKTLIQRQNWESLRLFWTWLQILDNSDDVLICREPVNFTKFFFLSVECDILEMILFLIKAHFWVIMGNLIYGINFS